MTAKPQSKCCPDLKGKQNPKSIQHRVDNEQQPSQDKASLNHFLRLQMFAAAAAKSPQSCLTLCDPIDGSPPGYAVPGIIQARTLEWVAISLSNA